MDLDFETFDLKTGIKRRFTDIQDVTCYGHDGGHLILKNSSTYFLIVNWGSVSMSTGEFQCHIEKQMFCVATDELSLYCERGRCAGLVIEVPHYRGLFQVGGPVEHEGRLKYIDGCSDSVLVSPPRLGEPCLNHLHIPPNINQSAHTHPSDRIGIILNGSGFCRTESGEHPLEMGMGWRIPAGCVHSFHTDQTSLDVIAWHPDSDFGPTDEDHPMINRTILKGGV